MSPFLCSAQDQIQVTYVSSNLKREQGTLELYWHKNTTALELKMVEGGISTCWVLYRTSGMYLTSERSVHTHCGCVYRVKMKQLRRRHHMGEMWKPVVPAAASRGRCPRPRHCISTKKKEAFHFIHALSCQRWGETEGNLFPWSRFCSLWCYRTFKGIKTLSCSKRLVLKLQTHFSVSDTDERDIKMTPDCPSCLLVIVDSKPSW